MPNPIARIFKALPLSSHIQWLVCVLVFPCIYWYVEPDMRDRPLERSEGRIAWMGNPRHGYELLLQTDQSIKKYEKLFIQDGRSSVPDRGSLRIGQHLRVDRYGDSIGNCWVGDKQICFSNCVSDFKCKQDKQARDRQFFPWTVGVMIFGYVLTLIWVACGGQIRPSVRRPSDSR
jgi:hypothetical protein